MAIVEFWAWKDGHLLAQEVTFEEAHQEAWKERKHGGEAVIATLIKDADKNWKVVRVHEILGSGYAIVLDGREKQAVQEWVERAIVRELTGAALGFGQAASWPTHGQRLRWRIGL